MSKQKCSHLVNNIPNNFVTRWVVKKINKKMRDSNSWARLEKRYRCPKKGWRYSSFGGLVPSQETYKYYTDGNREMPPVYKRARKFSLYLRKR